MAFLRRAKKPFPYFPPAFDIYECRRLEQRDGNERGIKNGGNSVEKELLGMKENYETWKVY